MEKLVTKQPTKVAVPSLAKFWRLLKRSKDRYGTYAESGPPYGPAPAIKPPPKEQFNATQYGNNSADAQLYKAIHPGAPLIRASLMYTPLIHNPVP